MDFLPDSGEDSCCESGAKMTKKMRISRIVSIDFARS
ncbi:hypothetical protein ACVME8_004818 [Bradyrhizobium diazoefficiens]